jgi:hypothetical protein
MGTYGELQLEAKIDMHQPLVRNTNLLFEIINLRNTNDRDYFFKLVHVRVDPASQSKLSVADAGWMALSLGWNMPAVDAACAVKCHVAIVNLLVCMMASDTCDYFDDLLHVCIGQLPIKSSVELLQVWEPPSLAEHVSPIISQARSVHLQYITALVRRYGYELLVPLTESGQLGQCVVECIANLGVFIDTTLDLQRREHAAMMVAAGDGNDDDAAARGEGAIWTGWTAKESTREYLLYLVDGVIPFLCDAVALANWPAGDSVLLPHHLRRCISICASFGSKQPFSLEQFFGLTKSAIWSSAEWPNERSK